MNGDEGKVTIYETYSIHQLIEHLFNFAMSAMTVRTLVVAVIDNSNWGVRWPNRVVAFIDWNRQIHCLHLTLSDASPHFAGIDPEFLHSIEKRAAFQSQATRSAFWTADATLRFPKNFNDSLFLFKSTYNRRRVDSCVHLFLQ